VPQGLNLKGDLKMTNFMRYIVGCLLLAATMFVLASTPVHHLLVRASQQDQKENLQEKLQRLKIQSFHGEAASLRAKQLRKLHKGVDRAMKDAEKRGLRPAFEQGNVILATDPAKTTNVSSVSRTLFPSSADLISPVSFKSPSTQDTFTNGDIEITFIPYDDGDPNTWEGIVYRFVPDIGEDTSYTVINIATEVPNVTQEVWYPPDGGDPQPVLLMSKQSQPGQPNSKEPPMVGNSLREQQTVSTSSTRTVAMWTTRTLRCPRGQHICLGAQNGECCSDGGLPGINTWLRKSLAGCTGASIGCLSSGPAWAHCWGTWCTGAMVAALIW
jgi:hypothetical protein